MDQRRAATDVGGSNDTSNMRSKEQQYTPDTAAVREVYYAAPGVRDWEADRAASFDRWLAAHDAEVRASVQQPTRELIAEAICQSQNFGRSLADQTVVWQAKYLTLADAVLALFPQPTSSAEPTSGPTVMDLASRHCETFTSDSTCADDPDRSAGSPYGATGYCYPCLIRNALSLSVAEPCCSRPRDLNWHTADGGHVVPPDIEEDTPVAEPVSIADMAPGTTFTADGEKYTVWDNQWGVRLAMGSDGIPQAFPDPSTIRDVTPPPATPEEGDLWRPGLN